MNNLMFDPKSLAVGLAAGVGATLLVAAQRPVPTTGPTPPGAVSVVGTPAGPRFQIGAYGFQAPSTQSEKGVFVLDTYTGRIEHVPVGGVPKELRAAQP